MPDQDSAVSRDRKHIEDGVIGIVAILTAVFDNDLCRHIGEESSTQLFVVAIQPDQLDNPMCGSELWDHLKATFPKDGGIDVEAIKRAMGRAAMATLTG